jgi:hypothetical protein
MAPVLMDVGWYRTCTYIITGIDQPYHTFTAKMAIE